MTDILGIDRRNNPQCIEYQMLKEGMLPNIEYSEKMAKALGMDVPIRVQMMYGEFPAKEGSNKKKSQYDKTKYQFMMNAPFEIANHCCRIMKKELSHRKNKEGLYPITAQMADESRLRTQKWLQHGCNGFDLEFPISNPMSFWTEQDVLMYIYLNKIEIAECYGNVVIDYGDSGQLEGQMNIGDFIGYEEFDLKRPILKTTGVERSGCFACGFGCHMKGNTDRFSRIDEIENPKIRDAIMRGGKWSDEGKWIPGNGGLGYWFILKWANIHGKFSIEIPEFERYEKEYGDEITYRYLYGD